VLLDGPHQRGSVLDAEGGAEGDPVGGKRLVEALPVVGAGELEALQHVAGGVGGAADLVLGEDLSVCRGG